MPQILRESEKDDYDIASMRKVFGAFFACVLLMFSCTGKQAQRVEESQTDSVADTLDSVPLDTLEQLLSEIPNAGAAAFGNPHTKGYGRALRRFPV